MILSNEIKRLRIVANLTMREAASITVPDALIGDLIAALQESRDAQV